MQNQHNNKFTIGILIVTLVLAVAVLFHPRGNDLKNNSVMVTNREQTSGGTGIILKSGAHKSQVLTNNHVCEVVKKGGVIVTTFGTYQVNGTKSSAVSDLCILTVLDDLYLDTKLASKAPKTYSEVRVSGYPALMPNVISHGHLSGRSIITILKGIKPCTPEDEKSAPLLCFFFKGIPQIQHYESVFTSATIMPGNSGSGVYNDQSDLIGVVFAGSSNFGYSWTVPYEQTKLFVETEAPSMQETLVSQEQSIVVKNQSDDSNKIKQATEKCNNTKNMSLDIKKVCKLLSFDMIWRK